METNELLKKVRKIEIKTRGISNQIFSGEYHSAFKGRGMSFSEVREYQYGDDIRAIDWNVTARFNHPYIKVFEEERELTLMLLIDISRSSFFGTVNQMKNELITEISAVLSFSALSNNDKVGIIFFSDKIEKFIPPKKGKSHILRIIRELIDIEPTGASTNISLGLEYLNNIIKKRAIVFLMSDLQDTDYEKALRFSRRKHDLVGIHIYDRREETVPDIGLAYARDLETGQIVITDFSNKKLREAYATSYRDNLQLARNAFLKAGADLMSIGTHESYIQSLLKFFKKRG